MCVCKNLCILFIYYVNKIGPPFFLKMECNYNYFNFVIKVCLNVDQVGTSNYSIGLECNQYMPCGSWTASC